MVKKLQDKDNPFLGMPEAEGAIQMLRLSRQGAVAIHKDFKNHFEVAKIVCRLLSGYINARYDFSMENCETLAMAFYAKYMEDDFREGFGDAKGDALQETVCLMGLYATFDKLARHEDQFDTFVKTVKQTEKEADKLALKLKELPEDDVHKALDIVLEHLNKRKK